MISWNRNLSRSQRTTLGGFKSDLVILPFATQKPRLGNAVTRMDFTPTEEY